MYSLFLCYICFLSLICFISVHLAVYGQYVLVLNGINFNRLNSVKDTSLTFTDMCSVHFEKVKKMRKKLLK